MSQNDYIILSPESHHDISVRPPLKPHPGRMKQKQKREFCWPFSCCCKTFQRKEKDAFSDDLLLRETECPPKSSPVNIREVFPRNENGFNHLVNIKEENEDTDDEDQLCRDDEDENGNEEEIQEEFDYPGSDLQNAIALSLQTAGIGGAPTEPECVICLDGFDPTNPRLPTLCQCGIGKVNFHHSCLKKWISQNGGSSCPSCFTTLFYEELEPVVAEPSISSLTLLNEVEDRVSDTSEEEEEEEEV